MDGINNTFIELFAGLGGMGYGLIKAGMECVGFVECDVKCEKCKTFTKHEPYKKKKFYTFCTVCGNPKKQTTHECFKILHDPEERMWAKFDITTVTDDDIRLLREQHRIDLISGGFPCQAFSIAGKREGFADATRGTLFFQIVRFANILKPQHILLENVKGLLNHDGGRTYTTILCALDELGYDCEWQLLNSKDFGVPQNRERVFIVCHLRGTSRREIFPISGENSKTLRELTKGEADANRVYDGEEIARTLKAEAGGGGAKTGWYTVKEQFEPKIKVAGSLEYYGNDQMNRVYDVEGLAPTLTTRHTGNEPKVLLVGNTNPSGNGMNGAVYDSQGLAPTLTTNKGEGTKILQRNFSKQYSVYEDQTGTLQASRVDKVPMVLEPMPCLTPDQVEKRQNGRRFKEPGDPMTAQDKHGVAIIDTRQHIDSRSGKGPRVYNNVCPTLNGTDYKEPKKITDGYRIRKLTPLECFRLQSYPDEWFYKLKEAGISDSQLYKMAGNGVTSNVAYEIGKRLIGGD
ncbi:DNA (cytosine-5-)-methyltransferase [Bacillus sp. 3255]|uniref:DNA (cytosine-5-)-methyltransferase n=1 Tax=Bacillus sp. 3255 TaxID=2817904 RepID=UPI00285B3FB0|nr:DNA (cytosine-5-)-methyltransferase [Bacillus sp. 3255]MDR6884888.1 DNA (cytosine-5)-methyltransferase 1 [Bacillus sp. 3255]